MTDDIIRQRVMVHPIDWLADNHADKAYSAVTKYNHNKGQQTGLRIDPIPFDKRRPDSPETAEDYVTEFENLVREVDAFIPITSSEKVTVGDVDLLQRYRTRADWNKVPTHILNDASPFRPDAQVLYRSSSKVMQTEAWERHFGEDNVTHFGRARWGPNYGPVDERFLDVCEALAGVDMVSQEVPVQ